MFYIEFLRVLNLFYEAVNRVCGKLVRNLHTTLFHEILLQQRETLVDYKDEMCALHCEIQPFLIECFQNTMFEEVAPSEHEIEKVDPIELHFVIKTYEESLQRELKRAASGEDCNSEDGEEAISSFAIEEA